MQVDFLGKFWEDEAGEARKIDWRALTRCRICAADTGAWPLCLNFWRSDSDFDWTLLHIGWWKHATVHSLAERMDSPASLILQFQFFGHGNIHASTSQSSCTNSKTSRELSSESGLYYLYTSLSYIYLLYSYKYNYKISLLKGFTKPIYL